MYVVTASEMQALDRATIEEFGLPGRLLMEHAGREAARVFLAHFGELARRGGAAVACGRGNNGGDGFVIARWLHQAGVPVSVFLFADPGRLAGEAFENFRLLAKLALPVHEVPDAGRLEFLKEELRRPAVWVDALLGTGLSAEVGGLLREAIDVLNSLGRPVFAVDLPSGLDADTGRVRGTCLRAEVTATFGFPKLGHLLYPGAALTGRLEVLDIGIPPAVVERLRPRQRRITAAAVRAALPPRPPDAHKGRTGHVVLIAGSPGKTGAAALAALAALRAGAGLVTVGCAASLNPVLEVLVREPMTSPLPEEEPGVLGPAARAPIAALLAGKDCLAVGPGLGVDPRTRELIRALVAESPLPLVLDADGLNALAGDLGPLAASAAPRVLTPHPGEAARLLGTTAAAVQEDRVGSARRLARATRALVVLKGAPTVIAHPGGEAELNPTGNAGMATAGMGDVLTGILAGLIAQGASPEAACRAAVWLHGRAADEAARTLGPRGYLAGEVMEALPGRIARLLEGPVPAEAP